MRNNFLTKPIALLLALTLILSMGVTTTFAAGAPTLENVAINFTGIMDVTGETVSVVATMSAIPENEVPVYIAAATGATREAARTAVRSNRDGVEEATIIIAAATDGTDSIVFPQNHTTSRVTWYIFASTGSLTPSAASARFVGSIVQEAAAPPPPTPVQTTSITVNNTVVCGETNSPLSWNFLLSAVGETGGFKAATAGDDVSSWFANLPRGLTATIGVIESDGSITATIYIGGTPTEPLSAPMTIRVPKSALVGSDNDGVVTVTPNPNAKFAIYNATDPFTIGTVKVISPDVWHGAEVDDLESDITIEVPFSRMATKADGTPYYVKLATSAATNATPVGATQGNCLGYGENYATASVTVPRNTATAGRWLYVHVSSDSNFSTSKTDSFWQVASGSTPRGATYPPAPGTTNTGRGSGSSSSGGGGGGGGGGGYAPPAANAPLTSAQGIAAVNAAVNGVASLNNPTEVALAVMQAMAKAAGAKGVVVNADTRAPDNSVDVRITFNPADATKTVNLAASTLNTLAANARATFTKNFSNTLSTVNLSQAGALGMNVKVAAKLNPALKAAQNLVFYVYDVKTNKYSRITTTYRVDKNGYIHFTTNMGGTVIISGGALAKK